MNSNLEPMNGSKQESRHQGYQELLKLEMLHEHQPSFFTIFVSHQWLAGHVFDRSWGDRNWDPLPAQPGAHPDPSSNQFRNLQKALRKAGLGDVEHPRFQGRCHSKDWGCRPTTIWFFFDFFWGLNQVAPETPQSLGSFVCKCPSWWILNSRLQD